MKERILKSKITSSMINRDNVNQKLLFAANNETKYVLKFFNSSSNGLKNTKANELIEENGKNIITKNKEELIIIKIFRAFINPFTLILLILAIVSIFTDIILAAPGDKNPITVIIITLMVMISGILRYTQETKSNNAAKKLSNMICSTACIERIENGKKEIPMEDIVQGDIIHLSAGDMIPADIRIIEAKDLFVSQSALSGESEAVEKTSKVNTKKTSILQMNNLAFMGSNVISGSAKGIVIATGNDTMLGFTAKDLTNKPVKTTFEKGVNSVSYLLIRFMLIMVPIVFFINGITKADWTGALLFAVSIAVGLTPEMLPMIVTSCLAKGATQMSKDDVIIKDLNAIQNLGSIDILCTDKTGTLTKDKVELEYHLDIKGKEDDRILRHAFLNSYYQTGLKNLMDRAIIERTNQLSKTQEYLKNLEKDYIKVDEIPFDFERRRMSVVIKDKNGKTQMITKGAIEEMLNISSHVEYEGKVLNLTDETRANVIKKVKELNEKGMRVLGIAQKNNPSGIGAFGVKDEKDMVLIGYLAFLDPPKESTKSAIKALKKYGVDVKILTGDNEQVTKYICSKVGIKITNIISGEELEKISDMELKEKAEITNIFVKLSPEQKSRIIRILRENGHSVGYMGDGINDAISMKESDVGISVDTAVDIAKESANVILLKKDLMVLEKGIIQGRKTYLNIIKYIKMTASSNFGNMFSVLFTSAFLPFLPMASIHLILLNFIYDLSCTTIPWDNVDEEFILKPKTWDASSISKFMLWIGPTSSVFDIITYLVMYFVICPLVMGGNYASLNGTAQIMFISLFQSGWFIESMWSQTLVIHMIRTPKIPFIQSRASKILTFTTFMGIALLTIIPFTFIGKAIGLSSLPIVYFMFLICIILAYMLLVTFIKKLYIKKYNEWL